MRVRCDNARGGEEGERWVLMHTKGSSIKSENGMPPA